MYARGTVREKCPARLSGVSLARFPQADDRPGRYPRPTGYPPAGRYHRVGSDTQQIDPDIVLFVIVEQFPGLRQQRVGAVLGREDDIFGGQTPVDTQRRVVPCNGALRFGGVGVVALVLERRFVAQHGEAVRTDTVDS